MSEKKGKVLQAIDANADKLFAIACDIFDHPEIGREEYYACSLLTAFLEHKGFVVVHGIGGLETAFRATWKRGSGGPAIGFMMEYDALRGMGHACGHHLQSAVCIGAALALMESCTDPFEIILYGTPDEEGKGGKIDMVNRGCFRDVDVMFAYHTGQKTCLSYSNKALAPAVVTFHGTPAHASGAPYKGRSALDAMMLAFHGLEIMREHVKDGCRIHYTIKSDTGPSNIVHETAKAHITLRSNDRVYLEDMQKRMKNIIDGACLMTDTTADIQPLNVYWNLIPVQALRQKALSIAHEIGAIKIDDNTIRSDGSTDVGNVSWIVPTLNLYTFYCEAGAHSVAYMNEGKSNNAFQAMQMGSKILALTALELIRDKSFLEKVRNEHLGLIKASE